MIRFPTRLICIVVLFSQTISHAQGQFEYVSHHTGSLFETDKQYFDLNSDGSADITMNFYSRISGIGSSGAFGFEGHVLNGSRFVTESFYFGNAVYFDESDVIGTSIPVRTDLEAPSPDAHPYNWLGDVRVTGFSMGGSSDGVADGIFIREESIFGIQILEEDGYHNGWLRVENIGSPQTGQTVRVADWAYNQNPNESILAGMLQVPEPRMWMMIVLGLVVLFGAQKRVRR